MAKQIAIALGGGGTKGYAHIGVLKTLEAAGYEIIAISGTSAGSLVGSLYAAGYTPDEIFEILRSANPKHIFDRRPTDRPSILALQGIEEVLRKALGTRTFAELKRPFGAVALDILSNRTIFLRSGPVVEAALASSAIPGVFPPIKLNDWLLVDGGTTDNVPVRLARLLAPRGTPVVAVALGLMPPEVSCFTEIAPPFRLHLLQRLISRLRYTQAFNTSVRAIEISLGAHTMLRLHVDQPEVLVIPAVENVDLLSTPQDTKPIVAAGAEAMEKQLPALHDAFSWKNRWRTRAKTLEMNHVVVYE